jgi:EpsI family protein
MSYRWMPALILVIGAVLTFGVARQRVMSLAQPLDTTIPNEFFGFTGQALGVSEGEAEAAGFSNHLLRVYETGDSLAAVPWFSLYIGFYESQTQGKTIHSPKNCLPGAGWEAVSSEAQVIELGNRTVVVNRYLLINEGERALVLYWYQGRGRIAYNEYRVKVDLLLDAAFRRRSDEALVRIVIPLGGDDQGESDLASSVAKQVIPILDRALPQ